MGPANLLFLVIVAAAPLLSAAKPLIYSKAKPSTVWINNNAQFNNSLKRLILIQDKYVDYGLNFGAGFLCVSTPTCDMYLFAVFIIYVGNGTSLFKGDPAQLEWSANPDALEGYPGEVVWSANRDRPVRENATLEFTSGGNLVLRDADDTHVWSSSNSGGRVMMVTKVGNLVLFDHMNAAVWQSFDHPTDTLVPGQSILEGMRLEAKSSPANWTLNGLYITLLHDGLYAYAESTPPQLYFSYKARFGRIGNSPTKATLRNGSLSFMFGQDMNDSITLPVAQSNQYMRLDSDGYLRLYEWSWSSLSWTVEYDIMGSIGMDACAYPTACGDYGICTGTQCSCPLESNSNSSYFKPVDERKPNLGCTPLTPISCTETQYHKLLAIPNISYYDNYTIMDVKKNQQTSLDGCKQECLKNCSCMAVLFKGGKCVWVTKVFSMQSIQYVPIGYESSVYLKVQLSPSNESKTKFQLNPSIEYKKVILGATLGAFTVLILLFIVVAIYVQRRRKYKDKDDEFDFDQLSGMPTRYSFEKLSECTDGFATKLGEGGFGSVFEGKLGDERVAVKRLEGARQGKKEFLAEVETIGSIEHINLVRLIGFCAEKSERLLVYEHVSRGSLDRWIYYHHKNDPLDWCTRCRIILDIAKGLCYLHEECRRKIVHLDIKPQNILLDDNFNAKLADFGLCKLINRDQSKVVTVMRGTPGYLAPEWLTSRITEKVDVYSFGVVVMEIISGRKNIDNSQPEENGQLINMLREKSQNNQLIDLIDKRHDDMVSHQEEVVQMIKLAIWCLQHDNTQRPSMSTVIKVLEGAISVQTFDANLLMFVQDNSSTHSVPSQASILSGPR